MASTEPPGITNYAHIVRTPGFMGGEPTIDAQRIRVRDVVAARDLGGYSPEEIASSVFPDLSLAEVYSALAYYEDHRAEIDVASENEAQFVEEFLREHPEFVRDLRPSQPSDDVPHKSAPWGEGIRRSAGALADCPELDEVFSVIQRQRLA